MALLFQISQKSVIGIILIHLLHETFLKLHLKPEIHFYSMSLLRAVVVVRVVSGSL